MAIYNNQFTTDNAAGVTGFVVSTTNTTGKKGIITSGGYAVSDSTSVGNALCTTAPTSADQAAQIKLINNIGEQSVWLRATSTGSGTATEISGYIISHLGSQVRIAKRAPGVLTVLSTKDHQRVAGQTLRGTINGSIIKLFIDGQELLSITDTTYTSIGTTGIRLGVASGVQIDDFYSGTIAEINAISAGGSTNTVPNKVVGVSLVKVTETDATLIWTSVSNATGYIVEFQEGVSGVWVKTNDVTTSSATAQNLKTATAHRARITAYNTYGLGTSSDLITVSTRSVVLRNISIPILDDLNRIPAEYMPLDVEGSLPDRLSIDSLDDTYGSLDSSNAWLGLNDFAQSITVRGRPIGGASLVSLNIANRSTLTITKKINGPILTKTQTGLRSIYFPCLIKVPDVVYQAYPTLGRWRIYYSTDHDSTTGQIGMSYCNEEDLNSSTAVWTVWKNSTGSPVMYTRGGSTQTETPTVIWNEITAKFHMYYQVQSGSGTSLRQFTEVALSDDGITWTYSNVALPPSPVGVQGHTGYAKVWYINGIWATYTLDGAGVATSGSCIWWSNDGLNWIRDPKRVKFNAQWSDGSGALLSGIVNLFRYEGRIWALGRASTPSSGSDIPALTLNWMAPMNNNLRSLAGRPLYFELPLLSGETSSTGFPENWATAIDGKNWGVYRTGTGSSSFNLAVIG